MVQLLSFQSVGDSWRVDTVTSMMVLVVLFYELGE
jgi:hypothetical protein